MARLETESPNGAPRRLLLVDFDWQDADLVPALLQKRGVSVRLVAGAQPDDAGVRLAELCGLPRTCDLADLTREIFDLALVSERSPRRTQIEGLLLALGTPSVPPQVFLESAELAADTKPALEAPLALHAAAFEHSIGGRDFAALVEHALPDISDDSPTAPTPVTLTGERRLEIRSLEDFPSLEDRQGLEDALRHLMADTGADRAELHVGGGEQMELIVRVGPEDPLLKGLIGLALELGTPQVVSSVIGPEEGKAWGAWPFRTSQRHGVVAAAGIDKGGGWATWQRVVEELRESWDLEDREKTAAAFPLVPEPSPGWVNRDEFPQRLELALERNRGDGLRFALYRLHFPASARAMEQFVERMPGQLRGTDCVCQPTPTTVLLLTAGKRETFPYVRRRILALWQDVWLGVGNERPVPGITDEGIEILDPESGESFLARAGEWLSGT